MRISRRAVIAGVAAVPAMAALAAVGLSVRWWEPRVGDGLAVLSEHEREFADALAEAWFPPGGTPALSGADAELGRWLDQALLGLPPTERSAIKVFLQVLDDLTLTSEGGPFRRLPLDRRTAVLRRWLSSGQPTFRTAFHGVIVMLGMGWTTHPVVAQALAPNFRCGWGP